MKKQVSFYENKLNFEINPWNLHDALRKRDDVVVIDTRSQDAYGARHIPGALNISHKEMTSLNTNHLDKEALYVTYCDGVESDAATRGALNMTRLGFRVKELTGGLDQWVQSGYTTDPGKSA